MLQLLGSANNSLAWLSILTFAVKSLFLLWCQNDLLKLPRLLQLQIFSAVSALAVTAFFSWYWVAKLESPVLTWPFKLPVLGCQDKVELSFLTLFCDIISLLLNSKDVILKIKSILYEYKIFDLLCIVSSALVEA